MLTVRDVAARVGVAKLDVDRAWIKSGELRATNISSGPGRPTWRIDPDDLERFLAGRRTRPTPPRRSRRSDPKVIRFY
jgi:excisionase family DNA binding protein